MILIFFGNNNLIGILCHFTSKGSIIFLFLEETVTAPNDENPRKINNSKPGTAGGRTGKYRNIKSIVFLIY